MKGKALDFIKLSRGNHATLVQPISLPSTLLFISTTLSLFFLFVFLVKGEKDPVFFKTERSVK